MKVRKQIRLHAKQRGYLSAALRTLLLGGSAWPYTIDLTSPAAPITVTRTGVQYIQTSASTAQTVAANTPAIETRDGWAGLWTHPTYTNDLPDDLSTWTVLNTLQLTQNYAAAPDGTATAHRVRDGGAGDAAALYRSPYGAARHMSIWVRDDASDPATDPGCLSGDATAVARSPSFTSGNTWRRVEVYPPEGTADIYAIWPAGQQQGPVTTAAATGGINAWAATSVAKDYVVPASVAGAIGNVAAALTQAAVGRLINAGALDLEWWGVPPWFTNNNAPAFTLWSLDSGAHSLRYTGGAAGDWILKISGVDVITAAVLGVSAQMGQQSTNGQLVYLRAWWNPATGAAGLRMMVNGALSYDKAGTATGSALTTPVTAWLGSDSGTSGYAPLRHYRLRANRVGTSTAVAPVGALLGDSVIASYDGGLGVAVASLLRSGASVLTAPFRSLAIAGNTIAQQKTAWTGYAAAEKSGLAWVILEIGLNDIDPAEAASVAITRLQDLVTTVRADVVAACKIYIGQLTPCKQRLIDVYGAIDGATAYTKWQDINTAIGGGGGTPITGVDDAITAHVAALDDGSGNLAAAYDCGDHIHPNNAGRQLIADAWITQLTSGGFL